MAEAFKGEPIEPNIDPRIAAIFHDNMEQLVVILQPEELSAILLVEGIVPGATRRGGRKFLEAGIILGYPEDIAHRKAIDLMFNGLRRIKMGMPEVHDQYVKAKAWNQKKPDVSEN